jgi:hypothetical protein
VHWSVLRSEELAIGRGRVLAGFIQVAHEFGGATYHSAINSLGYAMDSLDERQRYILLTQLNHYLADSDVPGRLKRDIRAELEEIRQKRPSKQK